MSEVDLLLLGELLGVLPAAAMSPPSPALPRQRHASLPPPATPASEPSGRLTFKARDLANQLAISPRTLHRWVAMGKIPPPAKVGTVRFWNTATIESWIESGCPRQASEPATTAAKKNLSENFTEEKIFCPDPSCINANKKRLDR